MMTRADFFQTIQGLVPVVLVQVLEVEPKAQVGHVFERIAPGVESDLGGVVAVVFDKKGLLDFIVTEVDFETAVVILETPCLFDLIGSMQPDLLALRQFGRSGAGDPQQEQG